MRLKQELKKKKNSQVKGSLGSDEFLTQPYPTFKELTSCFSLSHYSKRKRMTMNLFDKANLEKETTNKENYRLISVISIDVNILNKICANQMLLVSSQEIYFPHPKS